MNIDIVPKKKSGFVKWAMIVSIAILVNLLLNYTISLFYKAPQYEDFVKPSQVINNIETEDACLKVGGQWTSNPDNSVGIAQTNKNPVPLGYCDPNWTGENNFASAQKSYNRNIFITLVVVGIAILIYGALSSNIILSLAFSWGGVLSLLVASVRYWGDANNLSKVLILAVALGMLIWVAVKKFGDN